MASYGGVIKKVKNTSKKKKKKNKVSYGPKN